MHRHNVVNCTAATLTRVMVLLLIGRRLSQQGGH